MSRLSSEEVIDDIEVPFRVRAGPGAGKTFWLARHVCHVLRESNRLNSVRRIACISYTNVAAKTLGQEIVRQLGRPTALVESQTIHSFLFKNIVHPYVRLLRRSSGDPLVDHSRINGHHEHRPSYAKVTAWLSSTKRASKPFNNNRDAWFDYLKGLRWELTGTDWQLVGVRKPPDYLPTSDLGAYKHAYWSEGIIDHDDVLYLAHRLLAEKPEITPGLSARYPYVFVDEFQDSGQAQSDVLRWFAKAGSIIGVVGDPEQSIYKFNGAQPDDFDKFNPRGIVDYEIVGNRRSSRQIVDFLNGARRDSLLQNAVPEDVGPGTPVRVMIGPIEWALQVFSSECEKTEGDYVLLARSNKDVKALAARLEDPTTLEPSSPTTSEPSIYVDQDRAYTLKFLAEALSLLSSRQFGAAIHAMVNGLRCERGTMKKPWRCSPELLPVAPIDQRGIALRLLAEFPESLDQVRALTVFDAYNQMGRAVAAARPGIVLTKITKGKFRDAAESLTIGDLVDDLVQSEDGRSVRTVHKAKGAEFDSVLLHLVGKSELKHLLPGSDSSEEQRISYVGASRARKRLVLVVEKVDEDIRSKLEELRIKVVLPSETT